MLVGTNFCQSTEISNNMVPTKIRYVIYVLSKHLASQITICIRKWCYPRIKRG